jgi:hypothetical protein
MKIGCDLPYSNWFIDKIFNKDGVVADFISLSGLRTIMADLGLISYQTRRQLGNPDELNILKTLFINQENPYENQNQFENTNNYENSNNFEMNNNNFNGNNQRINNEINDNNNNMNTNTNSKNKNDTLKQTSLNLSNLNEYDRVFYLKIIIL